ncbi:hypothetical protein [Nocardia asteroides]|uniref:hypothetical protein n=1 Tax=Nocardia asteroides TaxID=1824 RepID=UPI0033D66449
MPAGRKWSPARAGRDRIPLTEREIAVSAVTIAVIAGFVGSLLTIRALGRANPAHEPMTAVGVLPVRATDNSPRRAMMDR